MKIITISFLAILFILIGVFNSIKYFVYFKNNPNQQESFDLRLKIVSDYIQALPKNTQKHIVIEKAGRETIGYLNVNISNIEYYYLNEIYKISPSSEEKISIIFAGWDPGNTYSLNSFSIYMNTVEYLKLKNPSLSVKEYRNNSDIIFITLSN